MLAAIAVVVYALLVGLAARIRSGSRQRCRAA